MFRPIGFTLTGFSLFAAALAVASFAAMADDASEARRAIEAEYTRLGTAIGGKDLDAIRAIHAPEYRELQLDGSERDLAAVMAAWQGALAAMLDPSLRVEIDSIDFDANEATVATRLTLSFATSPTPSAKASIRIEATNRDVWTKASGTWKLRRSDPILAKIWADGNLVSEMKSEPPLTEDERAAVVRDLAAQALPFKTVLAGNGFDDLAGLDPLIGNARLVSLGEASHGTAEFFQMKHRLLEYLVLKKGFTVFAIEGNWPEAEGADRYIKSGEGSAAAALAAMYFWTWQTAEVRDMLDWMRAYNASRGERPALSFTGFDMQTTAVAEQRVLDLMGRLSNADRDEAQRHYEGIAKLQESSNTFLPANVPAEDKARFRANAAAVLTLLEAKREALLKVATPEEFRDARQAARIVLQAVEMNTADNQGAERDRAMADNVDWLLKERFPDEKIVLWAHNGHVGTASQDGSKSQGMHLRERWGDRMVVLGFAFYQREVRAKRMTGGQFEPASPVALPLAPALKVSVEGVFHEAGLPRFILDFRRIPKDSALGAWLAKPHLHRTIGAGYDPDQHSGFYVRMVLPETYDGIIFIAESTAAMPLE